MSPVLSLMSLATCSHVRLKIPSGLQTIPGTTASGVSRKLTLSHGDKFFPVIVGFEVAIFTPCPDPVIRLVRVVDVHLRLATPGTVMVSNLLQDGLAPAKNNARLAHIQ